jgi:voltage-gated sodium channel
MLLKHVEYGVHNYWKNGWNRLDGILVILSIPSVLAFLFPNLLSNLSFLLILRLLRILRFFRIMHFFPNFSKIIKGFKLAMSQTWGVLLSFFVIIAVLGMINCSLFGNADPEHFCTPIRSIYSVFQICTIEGWYDIPNTVAEFYGASTWVASLVRFYFCLQLILGGIIGMSFINSIFVDAMASDNNDEIERKIDELNRKIDELMKKTK